MGANKSKLIGVNLTGEYIRAGRISQNSLEDSTRNTIDNFATRETVLQDVIKRIASLFTEEVEGIGIGVPSLVDVEKGIVYDAINIPSWREVHLKDLLEERFRVPVYVNNDANCFAAGEKYFGKARDINNMVGLWLGTGMGAGLIIDGSLYSGSNCGAGEFGSIPYREKNYEYYCTEPYFDIKYGLKPPMLYKRADRGDKIALAIFEQLGYDLGNAIKTILFAVDPDALIIGGPIAAYFELFKDAMWKNILTFPYKRSLNTLTVEASEHPDISLLGAAALYYDAMKRP